MTSVSPPGDDCLYDDGLGAFRALSAHVRDLPHHEVQCTPLESQRIAPARRTMKQRTFRLLCSLGPCTSLYVTRGPVLSRFLWKSRRRILLRRVGASRRIGDLG